VYEIDVVVLFDRLCAQRAGGVGDNRRTPLGDAALKLKTELRPLMKTNLTAAEARAAASECVCMFV
jgi:hypothetical protein